MDNCYNNFYDDGIDRILGSIIGRFNVRFPLADNINIHMMEEFSMNSEESYAQ